MLAWPAIVLAAVPLQTKRLVEWRKPSKEISYARLQCRIFFLPSRWQSLFGKHRDGNEAIWSKDE